MIDVGPASFLFSPVWYTLETGSPGSCNIFESGNPTAIWLAVRACACEHRYTDARLSVSSSFEDAFVSLPVERGVVVARKIRLDCLQEEIQ